MNMKGLLEITKEALNISINVKVFLLVWLGAYVAFIAMYFISGINNPTVFLIGCGIAGMAAAPIYKDFAGPKNDGIRSIPR